MNQSKYITRAAKVMGAQVSVDPEWGKFVQVVFKNGGRFLYKGGNLGVNRSSSVMVSNDKNVTDYFLRKAKLPTVAQSGLFFSQSYAEAIRATDRNIDGAMAYAIELGWPVIVKPNGGSQGVGVSLVHNKRQFASAMKTLFRHYNKVLVQKPVGGRDYRLLTMGDEFIAAYHRIPLSIKGNGRLTVQELLLLKRDKLKKVGRHVKLDLDDPRILQKLRESRFDYKSVPARGQIIYLLDNANLSTGGDAVDVTDVFHPEYKEIALKVTRAMGLVSCGVDLLIEGDISQPPVDGKWCVLEVNACPGVSHFVTIGRRQRRMVEHMYTKALQIVEASFD